MNGYNFTEHVRRVLARAREEAVQLDHEFVGTEHLLLALLRENDGVSAAVLQNLGANPDTLRTIVYQTVVRGKRPLSGPDRPYTGCAKKVLELAMASARDFTHQYVGTEHLLLGLLREEKGIAAQVLTDAGVTVNEARAETQRLLGQAVDHSRGGQEPAYTFAAPSPSKKRPVLSRDLDSVREHGAWTRLTRALEVNERLGTPPALTLEPDGTLTVPLGPDFLISVEFPPSVRLRRRETERMAEDVGDSAEEPT